jgi:hypothetical protein
MTDLDEFITQYVAVWNEANADVRKPWIAGTWSERASLFNRIKEYHGHSGIEAAVQRSHDLFGSRGFLFRPREDPVSHHGAVQFKWEMVTGEDGEVDSLGTQFLLLDVDGRIRLDYQFNEQAPTS